MKQVVGFCVFVILVTSCAVKEKDEEVASVIANSCRTADTVALVAQTDVVGLPTGTPNWLANHYTVTKYLYLETYDIHILGTSGVSNWMMVYSYEMARNMVAAISSDSNRAKLNGHQFFVITDSDPIVPGGIAGQRNTGNQLYTIINEALVCASAVDTIRPDNDPVYRAWDTPIHEFAHAIELALGARDSTVSTHRSQNPNFSEQYSAEYFAWASEKWFDARITGTCGTDAMDTFEGNYMNSFLSRADIWLPTCAGRP